MRASGYLVENCGMQVKGPGSLHIALNVPAVLGLAMALWHGTPGFSRNQGLISSALPTMPCNGPMRWYGTSDHRNEGFTLPLLEIALADDSC